MNGPNSPQRDDGGVGLPGTRPVSHPRPGWEILPCLSTDHRRRQDQAGPITAAVAESERLRGTLGALDQGGVSLAAHPLWGSVAPPCADAIREAFSSREESSGEG